MQILSSVLAAIAALSLAGFVTLSAPKKGGPVVNPGPAQTNEGPVDFPPKR